VWRPHLFGRAGSRTEDTQISIDLQAVGINDSAAVMLGQRQRQRRFSAGGRPGDDDNGGLAQLSASFEASLREAAQDEGFSLCHKENRHPERLA